MIPAAFEYYTPRSVNEALTLLDQHGDDAKILAGGHSLLPALKLRLSSVGHLIDIGRIADLAYIKGRSGEALHWGTNQSLSGRILVHRTTKMLHSWRNVRATSVTCRSAIAEPLAGVWRMPTPRLITRRRSSRSTQKYKL